LSVTDSGITIYKGIFGGRDVAVKKFSQQNDDVEDYIKKTNKEIGILEQIDGSENIIRYFFFQLDNRFAYIVLELFICNLEDYRNSAINGQISDKEILQQLSNGVQHLHKLNIGEYLERIFKLIYGVFNILFLNTPYKKADTVINLVLPV
jgi:serine/threonine protein kinase